MCFIKKLKKKLFCIFIIFIISCLVLNSSIYCIDIGKNIETENYSNISSIKINNKMYDRAVFILSENGYTINEFEFNLDEGINYMVFEYHDEYLRMSKGKRYEIFYHDRLDFNSITFNEKIKLGAKVKICKIGKTYGLQLALRK